LKTTFVIENLSYTQEKNNILKSIHFSYETGDIVCGLGNNGSGKSTLLKIAAGLFKPSCGNVMLNGNNIFQISEANRASLIGWQPQNIERPFQMTLDEFMQLTPSPNQQKYLEQFEVDHLKSKNINTFSGGEWKRAQLARLWQTKAPLLLLDEPDSDLDLRHKKKLAQFCKDYVQENKAILLLVTHDIIFARAVATQIIALSHGSLVWNSKATDFWDTKVINKIYSTKVY
jgi:iron complex transport system ATP-binding protein